MINQKLPKAHLKEHGMVSKTSSTNLKGPIKQWVPKSEIVNAADGLEHNLLSISQFCDNGYDVLFEKANCTVINKNDKSIVFKGSTKSISLNWLIRR